MLMTSLVNVKYVKRKQVRVKKVDFPLHPVTIDAPFQQWGLDVIGPINPASSLQHKFILTTTDYFTRWAEVIPLRVVNTNQVITFLETHIITRFGVLNL
jgi:hypothetical protein